MEIADGPHYEIPSAELAKWVDGFGPDHWWMIDGDVYLESRLTSSCRGDELAAVLRRANRPILVQAPKDDAAARGQVIGADQVERLATPIGDAVYQIDRTQPLPEWADDKSFWMAWKGEPEGWLLSEDARVTRVFSTIRTTPDPVVEYDRK